MILLMERGHDQAFLFDLDMVSFSLLLEGSNRVAAMEKMESAVTMFMASQGDDKGMKARMKAWERIARGDDDAEAENTVRKRFPRGF